MNTISRVARLISGAGMFAVGALHLLWALGLPWPARNREELAELVVGNSSAMPGGTPTAMVAGVALVGGVGISGLAGEGGGVKLLRWMAATALLTSALVGGSAALRALHLPPAEEKFQMLDTRFYRPLCAILGIATVIGLSSPRSKT